MFGVWVPKGSNAVISINWGVLFLSVPIRLSWVYVTTFGNLYVAILYTLEPERVPMS